jgi:hypothetical protein
MKHRTTTLSVLALGVLLLAGCHTPDADLTTTQDPKYPVGRQTKIAFPVGDQVTDVDSRLADEFAQQEMREMGFTIVSPDQADYLMQMKVTPRDLTVAESDGSPGLGTAVGGGSDGMFTGVGIGIPLGPAEAVTIHRTELDANLATTQSPAIVVWQGKILADTDDVAKYRAPFYRALLSRVGATFNATIRLDKRNEVTPNPNP